MINVLHICSFYVINDLYKNLFNSLYDLGVNNTVYIPCKEKFCSTREKKEGNIELLYEPVYKNGDRYLEKLINVFQQTEFYTHNKEIYKRMKPRINCSKIDLVHAHSVFTNGFLAYKLHLETGINYFVAVRNTDVNIYFKRNIHLRKLGIDIMRRAKKIIFISKSYKDEVLEKYVPKEERDFFAGKSMVIPNGIDEFWLDNISRGKTLRKNELRLIQVGRIDKNKNVDISIKVCEELIKEGINANITIIGDGPLKSKIYNENKNKTYVNIVDRMNKEKIKEYFAKSDIFIMPSKYETFGLVYPEAMSSGLPIIYTKKQGFDGFFKEGYIGYSMECSNYKMGAEVVKKILENYSQISENAIISSKRFSWFSIAKEYEELYLNNKSNKLD